MFPEPMSGGSSLLPLLTDGPVSHWKSPGVSSCGPGTDGSWRGGHEGPEPSPYFKGRGKEEPRVLLTSQGPLITVPLPSPTVPLPTPPTPRLRSPRDVLGVTIRQVDLRTIDNKRELSPKDTGTDRDPRPDPMDSPHVNPTHPSSPFLSTCHPERGSSQTTRHPISRGDETLTTRPPLNHSRPLGVLPDRLRKGKPTTVQAYRTAQLEVSKTAPLLTRLRPPLPISSGVRIPPRPPGDPRPVTVPYFRKGPGTTVNFHGSTLPEPWRSGTLPLLWSLVHPHPLSTPKPLDNSETSLNTSLLLHQEGVPEEDPKMGDSLDTRTTQ